MKQVKLTDEEKRALSPLLIKNYYNINGVVKCSLFEAFTSAMEELEGEEGDAIRQKMKKKTKKAIERTAENLFKKMRDNKDLELFLKQTRTDKVQEELNKKIEMIKQYENIQLNKDKLLEAERLASAGFKPVIKIDFRSKGAMSETLARICEQIINFINKGVEDKLELDAWKFLAETTQKQMNAVDPLEILQEVEEKTKQFTTTEAKQEIDGFSQLSTKDNT